MLEKLHNQTGTYPKQGGGSANHVLGNQEYLSWGKIFCLEEEGGGGRIYNNVSQMLEGSSWS